MSAYAKTAIGETLTYRPADLDRYAGEQFCLRITPEEIDLDRCFFVYLDERFEGYSLRALFETYFVDPGPAEEAEMASWLQPWRSLDPLLLKKYMLLRQMAAKVYEQSGKVLFYINHGPGPVNPDDIVKRHLGTSVFVDGSFDDKILDLVVQFNAEEEPLAELRQWRRFDPIDTTLGQGSASGTKRRNVLVVLALAVIAILSLPALLFSRKRERDDRNRTGGFWGGML